MKTFLMVCAVVLLLPLTGMAEMKSYGNGVQLSETTAVADILDRPGDYIGKTVRIEGMVLEVCTKRGCWMYIAGERQGDKIQVKVTDGEIVFPVSAAGSNAVVEGVVEELTMSREDMVRYFKHLAEEKGQPFDPASVKDERIIRLRGTGALIEG